ncbi:zinc-binding dehydrogenase, partial [bacterium]|nr:zinc-binding dehydrogenase [bacterium]
TVAVFSQGPIGLCATAGAKLRGATTIIAVETVPKRIEMSKRIGADIVVDFGAGDPVDEIMHITQGRGVDVAIEALGLQSTFESCLRILKPGGTLSCLGVYSEDLTIPLDAFHTGLGDNRIVTSLCPGGKERMRRLMNVIASERFDFRPPITHHFDLEQIEDAYELFANQRDGVLKIAITP